MHGYFLVDGDKHRVDPFIQSLANFHYTYTNTSGESYYVKMNLSEPRLVCLRFHRQALRQVLGQISPYKYDYGIKSRTAALRLALGCRPWRPPIFAAYNPQRKFVNLELVGTRDDCWRCIECKHTIGPSSHVTKCPKCGSKLVEEFV
jgi:ssDNA-binding Zn-finger/Zn-ribbon topoisomerase 1